MIPAPFVTGIAGVLIAVAWRGWLDHAAKMRELRAECDQRGHNYGESFGSGHGRHRNCQRCNKQQHQTSDGSWL